MTSLEIADLPADRLPADLLAVPLYEDVRTLDGPVAAVDWRLDGLLTRMMTAGELSGRKGEQLALQGNHRFCAPWILVVGCGRWRAHDRDDYVETVERIVKSGGKACTDVLGLCLPCSEAIPAGEAERIVREALTGLRRPAVCRLSRVSRLA